MTLSIEEHIPASESLQQVVSAIFTCSNRIKCCFEFI